MIFLTEFASANTVAQRMRGAHRRRHMQARVCVRRRQPTSDVVQLCNDYLIVNCTKANESAHRRPRDASHVRELKIDGTH